MDDVRSTSAVRSVSRAAGPAIKGYAYQFDATILAILKAERGQSVVVEGCEDFDVEDVVNVESVQCKYLEGSTFSLAGLREPILPMLKAFVAGNKRQYRLYAHYADNSLVPALLNVDELRGVLTEQKRKPPETVRHYAGIPDADLADFVQNFRIEVGPSYEAQQLQVRQELAAHLGGSIEDAEDLYHANAQAYIRELAVQSDASLRRITRAEFIERLNKRPVLFTRWHQAFLSKERFYQIAQRRAKRAKAILSTQLRCLIVDCRADDGEEYVRKLAELICTLADKEYAANSLLSAQPWTVVLNGSPAVVISVKRRLADRATRFNDGYEHLMFNPEIFNSSPVVNRNGNLIGKASYHVRVIGIQTYSEYLSKIVPPPDVIINCSPQPAQSYKIDHALREFHVPIEDPGDVYSFLQGVK